MVSFVLMCCLGQNQESQCLGDTLSKERTLWTKSGDHPRPMAAGQRRIEGISVRLFLLISGGRTPDQVGGSEEKGTQSKRNTDDDSIADGFRENCRHFARRRTAEFSYRRKSCMGKNAKPTAGLRTFCFSSSLLTWLPRRFEASSDPKWRRERIANESRRRPPITTMEPERTRT